MQRNEAYRDRILEGHPEVAFCRLAGRVLLTSKKTVLGMFERLEVINRYIQPLSLKEVAIRAQELKCNEDDILDAACLAIVSDLHMRGKTDCVPKEPMADATGLYMQMIIPEEGN